MITDIRQYYHIGIIIKESKFLGFNPSDSKNNNYCDMLREMRQLYAKSYKLLRTFIQCSMDVKIT